MSEGNAGKCAYCGFDFSKIFEAWYHEKVITENRENFSIISKISKRECEEALNRIKQRMKFL
jgi:hypothetical protein